MKLHILKNLVLTLTLLSTLVATAACPRRTSNCGKSRRAPITRICKPMTCGKTSLKISRKSGCGSKTTIITKRSVKGDRSGACDRPIVPGRYRVRFEKHTFTNGSERIEFQRPVRTRY